MTTEIITAEDGLDIPVQIRGAGRPLVIVPGWTGGAVDWEPVLRRLSGSFRCHLWGNRASLGGPSPAIPHMARDLRDLLHRLDLRDALVVGHSMGAMTVWEHVRQFGCAHLGALCFIDQSPKLLTDSEWTLGLYGGFNPADNNAFVAAMRADFTEAVMELIRRSRSQPPQGVLARLDSRFMEARRQYIAALDPEPWIRCWESLAEIDCRNVLPDITVPTMLAYGDLSAFYGPAVSEWVHARIAGSVLHRYPLAAHSPHLEAMDGLVQDLTAFGAHGRRS